jgi:hypothetical protein
MLVAQRTQLINGLRGHSSGWVCLILCAERFRLQPQAQSNFMSLKSSCALPPPKL